MPTLTEHLTHLKTTPSYPDATRHFFLTAAGNGTLPSDCLAFWLSQDAIYAAHAYPQFIGSLIASIPFEDTDSFTSARETKNQDILQLFIFCLENVAREVQFFKDTAALWNLKLEGWKERKGTRAYTAEMARVSKNGTIDDGLIFLWAMERVYLDAWTYVAQKLRDNGLDKPTSAIQTFATNWSSPEFVQFVDRLATLVDSLDITPGSDAWKRAEAIWARVVELEVDFWPQIGEEVSQRAGGQN